MFGRIRLFILELRLQHYLGKHHLFRNEVHDQGAVSVRDRIRIAQNALARPPLELSHRRHEYQRIVNRGETP